MHLQNAVLCLPCQSLRVSSPILARQPQISCWFLTYLFSHSANVPWLPSAARVRSSSTNGFSVVWVEFDWDTDIYLARQIVSEKLSLVNEELPENVGKPTMGPQSSILGEVLIVGLTSDSTSMIDLRTIADWTIRPRLLSTGGVAQVSVLGGDIKEYQVLIDPARMRHYGVSLDEVMAVTRNMNQNVNGGIIYEHSNEYIVRGMLSTTNVEQIGPAHRQGRRAAGHQTHAGLHQCGPLPL